MGLALEGIKVVDVSQVAAVPMAARHLADFGADVIHVEPPLTGDSWRAFQPGAPISEVNPGQIDNTDYIDYNWENYNRNKRGVVIDLSQEKGQQIIYRFLSKADVFITNLRLWERERYNLEYDTLRQRFPQLIYGSLTGYGKKGPDSNNPAYDTISYWSRGGVGHLFSMPTVPPFIDGGAFGDNVAALGIAFGIMMALFVREKTGVVQEVDLSLFHTGVYQLTFFLSGTLSSGLDIKDWSTSRRREDAINPLILPYETKDGRWLLLSMPQSDRYWSRFCRAIEREDIANDPRFDSFESRAENHSDLLDIMEGAFRSKTLAEWKTGLKGLPFGVYQNLLEVINDPQARANDFFTPYDHPTHGRIEQIANPVNLSETPATIRMPAPEFGQHTEEVLLEYGYTWEDIEQFKQQGAIF